MQQRKKGLDSRGAVLAGMAFAVMGILARVLTRVLLGDVTSENMEVLAARPGMMPAATAVLVLESLSVCAVPIFAQLMVEAVQFAKDYKKLFLGLGFLAVITEIPYDLALFGRPFEMSQQNPMFALLLCPAVLWCFEKFPERGIKSILIWVAAMVAGIGLCYFLRLEYGLPLLLCICILWNHRLNPASRTMAAVLASALCVLLSPYYIATPIGALVLHFYHREEAPGRTHLLYLIYPAALTLAWAVAMLF